MSPVTRPLMRPTTRAERRLTVVVAAATTGVFGMTAVVVGRDRLLVALAGLALIVLAAVIAVLVEWWRRVDAPDGPRFWQLPSARRRALRRDLVTGRTGSVADRPYAGFWLGRRLRYPANSAMLIGWPGWVVGLAPGLSWTVAAQ